MSTVRHMDTNDATAAELRAALARQRLTGGDLAKLLGRSRMWTYRRLGGDVSLRINDLQLIADALGLPLSALLPADHEIARRAS